MIEGTEADGAIKLGQFPEQDGVHKFFYQTKIKQCGKGLSCSEPVVGADADVDIPHARRIGDTLRKLRL